ncbi:MAG: hypothetical protein Q3988_02830 [Gemella sp.]|nr:hypothetical protein [Gemella sp.]
MRNNKKISSILVLTLVGTLFSSPLNYVKAEETSTTALEKPSSVTETTEKELIITRWIEILEDKDLETKDRDKKPEEKDKENKPEEKDLKPEKKGEKPEQAGKIEGYEFVETDKSEPGVIKHIFKKKDIVTKWEDSEGKELKPEAKGKEAEKSGTIDGYVFETTEKSKDGLTVTHIFKKKDGSDTKEATETSKEAEPKKSDETTKSNTTPKVEVTTKQDGDTTKSDSTTEKSKSGGVTTVSTTERPVPQNATEPITTATNSKGEQNPIVQTTTSSVPTTTKKDVLPTPPKFTSIFVNEKTGYEIANAREGKSKIDIAGYEFVKTVEAEDGKFIHYYKAKNEDKTSKKTTVWKDVYSEEQLLSAKSGDHQAGYITGYTYVTTKNFGTTTVHYFKKVVQEKKNYNWSFHRDIDTGEIIYYDFNRTGWYHPVSILGYSYVDTDSWTDSAGITYHTHYYQRISTPIVQVDPAKVFTVWVDEHYNQILPSRMGSHDAGELDGYEFERTVSINSGYGIAHVFKKTDSEERLAGKDKDKSMGYRVRSMLPRTSSTGGTNYLPLVATGAGVGAVVGAIVYFVMRRKNNNDQNNNNFPPHSGQ